MNATWLFAEAYKYRRLRECFSVSKHWADYDVFFRQKVCETSRYQRIARETSFHQCDTFSRSTDAVFELSLRFAEPFQHARDLAGRQTDMTEAERLMFLELTQS